MKPALWFHKHTNPLSVLQKLTLLFGTSGEQFSEMLKFTLKQLTSLP